jgi:hypothetical protein
MAIAQWLIANGPHLIDLISQIMMAIVVLATALVRLPFLKKYAAEVDSLGGKLIKAISYAPTIGINPRTKALEDALKDQAAQKETEKAS